MLGCVQCVISILKHMHHMYVDFVLVVVVVAIGDVDILVFDDLQPFLLPRSLP